MVQDKKKEKILRKKSLKKVNQEKSGVKKIVLEEKMRS